MDKCRICMKMRKRMHSLYDSMEKNASNLGSCITYAAMVTSISNVKISKHDGLPDEICIGCCKRLNDIYDFRCLIERSDIEIQKKRQYIRIMFTDIQDIKCKIEIEENDSKDAMVHNDDITAEFVRSTEELLNYNSTIIKRLACSNTNDQKSLSVKEFMESIKEDPDNECDIVYDVAVDCDPESDKEDYTSEQNSESESEKDCITKKNNNDEDYEPYKYKYKKKKTTNEDKRGNTMPIKPVFLSDIRVARAKLPYKQRRKRQLQKKPKDLKEICPYCGKMFRALNDHLLSHQDERGFKCDTCSKGFNTKAALSKHKLSHATGKVYQCDECVAFFRIPYQLKTHIQRQHLGQVTKIPCEKCDKSFRTKIYLLRHCQGIHNMGIKKFNCEQCTMSFMTRTKLNHHMRIHTRERPYKCDFCSQPYSYKRDFDRHCLKKHGVFIKSRQVSVMNEETLTQERAVMRDLKLRVSGVLKDDKPVNPFEGPHAVKSFYQAIKALESNQIIIDL